MKITSTEAFSIRVPVDVPALDIRTTAQIVLVTIQTDTGLRGTGVCRGNWQRHAVREFIVRELASFLRGRDPLDTERVWKDAASEMAMIFQRPTGVVALAMSAVDLALWDIKGIHVGQPVYRLLGGASDDIEVYTTFGFRTLDRDRLVEVARRLTSEGHDKLKMQALTGSRGEQMEEDVARVRLVREAIGPGVRLMLDGNCRYDGVVASRLAKLLEPYDLTFFDDPTYGRDVRSMAQLRRRTSTPIASRGAYDDLASARDMIAEGAVDVVQMNVIDAGGYTECAKVAHAAELWSLPVATGGAHYWPNAHLIAGLRGGWMTEYHLVKDAIWNVLTPGLPQPANGRLRMPDRAGIGWNIDDAAVREHSEP